MAMNGIKGNTGRNRMLCSKNLPFPGFKLLQVLIDYQ